MDEHGYLRIVGRLKVWSKPESESVANETFAIFHYMYVLMVMRMDNSQTVRHSKQSVSQSLTQLVKTSVSQTVCQSFSQSVS